MVAAPLEVVAGLKLPHPPGLQLHATPEFFTSLVTVAANFAAPDAATVKLDGDTLTAIGRIEIVALVTSAELAAEVAVIVTVPPAGCSLALCK